MSERPDDPDGHLDIDARFADIVAHFDDGVGERRGSTQGTEDDDPGPDPAARSGPPAEPRAPAPPPPSPSQPSPPPSPRPRARPSSAAPPPRPPGPAAEDDDERAARIDREIEAAVHGPDGGRYVPPEPGPIPRTTPLNRLAWAAVIAGPLLLVLAATLWRDMPEWLVGAVVVAVVVGFLRLVWQLPRSGEGREDDGAQV